MDDPYITMEECIQLMADKGHRRGQEFNWETATYGTVFRMPPYLFNYPTRSLSLEEILAKFIDEGKREHEEIEIFINEFRTTNELLLKERSNLLSELKIEFNDAEPWYAIMLIILSGKVVSPIGTSKKEEVFSRKFKTYFLGLPSGFFIGTGVFQMLLEYVRRCDVCQRSGNISSRNEMPQNNIQVEAQSLPTNNACVVVKFLRSLFARFGAPKALISDRGTNFCNSQLEKDLQKYGVTHKISTTYHPQTNGQTEVTNRAIKHILERSVEYNPRYWSEKLNDVLWAFRTAYKTPTSKSRLMQLNELAELRDNAYENTRIYKERTKKWHDSRLCGDKDFKVGDQVLLYNSRLKMYPRKLKSKWSGPNFVKTVYPCGAIEIIDENGFSFQVNGQRLKKYYEGKIDKEDHEVIEFENGIT
ncbi:reverse transcriptase domain-containing protein [Tanacetum coccineum]|uniref:Reverse transcriptase domain-containing protein n=1 Tax=Tanacetum coccineum TaxID=301880 RepID=A0ABQ5FK84_9ASTR